MSTTQSETTLEELVARLANLERANTQMNEELTALRAGRPISAKQAATGKRKTRRGLLRKGLGAVVATLGTGALLEISTSTAHANGNEGPTTFTQTAGGNTAAVTAKGSSGSYGILAQSDSHTGISAQSTSGTGVYGTSTSGTGVQGFSSSHTGVYAQSTSGIGVDGESNSGTGVYGICTTGVGVYATSSNGTALLVNGHMKVQGNAVGQATLLSGQTSVTVTTSAATTSSNILLTPLSNPKADLWVTRAAGSFTINASAAPTANVTITYLIINWHHRVWLNFV